MPTVAQALYCINGHDNPQVNNFCIKCGNKLLLQDNYRIVEVINKGGFGEIFLAENTQSKQRVILKKFAPDTHNPDHLQKAEELFIREAAILRRLHHPQIVKLLDNFTFMGKNEHGQGTKEYKFLVLEYIQGQNFNQLLTARKQLSEPEVKKFLLQVLPILKYVHEQNIIHRDLSPDNIILRQFDGQPVLIDFGGAKDKQPEQNNQGWAKNMQQKILTTIGVNKTRLGKVGYAPEEQFRTGEAFISSDLYSLGVTALVLLTGANPEQLYDQHKGNWYWGKKIKVSSEFEQVLRKMVAYLPTERYQTTDEVMYVLNGQISGNNSGGNNPIGSVTKMATMLLQKIAPKQFSNNTDKTPWIPKRHPDSVTIFSDENALKIASFIAIGGAVAIGVTVVGSIFHKIVTDQPKKSPTEQVKKDDNNSQTKSPFSPEEQTRRNNIFQRQKQLKVSDAEFNRNVDREFKRKYPDKVLTNDPKDRNIREEWYDVAEKFLEQKAQAQNN
jgi:serine/threonine protein kinase